MKLSNPSLSAKKNLNILSSVTYSASKSSLKSLSNLPMLFVAILSAIKKFLDSKSFIKIYFFLLIDGEKLILNWALDLFLDQIKFMRNLSQNL